jgi:hypothetical protein
MPRNKKSVNEIITRMLDDFLIRLRAGEQPDIETYVKQAPKHEKAIRKAFTDELHVRNLLNPGAARYGALSDVEVPGARPKTRIEPLPSRVPVWGEKAVTDWITEADLPDQQAKEIVDEIRAWLTKRIHQQSLSKPADLSTRGMVTAGSARVGGKKTLTAFALRKSKPSKVRTRTSASHLSIADRIKLKIQEMSLNEAGKLYLKLKPSDVTAVSQSENMEVVLESENERIVLGDFNLSEGNFIIDLELQMKDST